MIRLLLVNLNVSFDGLYKDGPIVTSWPRTLVSLVGLVNEQMRSLTLKYHS